MKQTYVTRLVTALLVGTLSASAPMPAWADEGVAAAADDVERAKAWFKAGATAYASGDYLAAIQALEAAYRLTPLPPIAFSLAQAERRQYFASHDPACLGRAIELYRRYVHEVPVGGRRGDALDALGQLEPLSATSSPRPDDARAAASAEAARPKTRLLITADAPDARVALDADADGPSPLICEVTPGAHRLRAMAPGYVSEDREVVAVEGELVPVAVALRERPSMLRVDVPSGAEIYVDGLFAGRSHGFVELPLASGSHRLAIAQRGHRVYVEDLGLSPGEARTVAAHLEPTTQRRVATAFFVAGGVALGAALVTGGLALNAQNKAEDFLRRRETANVSPDDLRSYQSDVQDRNRYRGATAIAAGLSLGLLATGLFLHLLDGADPEELRGTSAPAGRGPGSAVVRSPLFSRLGVGLAPGAGEGAILRASALFVF